MRIGASWVGFLKGGSGTLTRILLIKCDRYHGIIEKPDLWCNELQQNVMIITRVIRKIHPMTILGGLRGGRWRAASPQQACHSVRLCHLHIFIYYQLIEDQPAREWR